MPIPMTDAQVIEQGRRLLTRLSRHLDAVERNDEGAGDELAAVLRILIDWQDKGNRAMYRLAAVTGQELQRVLVSQRPEPKPVGRLLLAFGSLPVIYSRPELGKFDTPRTVAFRDWVEAPSILVPAAERSSLSWSRFAALVANTTGSHLSRVYHDILVTSDLF